MHSTLKPTIVEVMSMCMGEDYVNTYRLHNKIRLNAPCENQAFLSRLFHGAQNGNIQVVCS